MPAEPIPGFEGFEGDWDHLRVLLEGVTAWNKWRLQNPEIRPLLGGAELIARRLTQANLSNADLQRASLGKADFRGAELLRVYLAEADLRGADLRGAERRRRARRHPGHGVLPMTDPDHARAFVETVKGYRLPG